MQLTDLSSLRRIGETIVFGMVFVPAIAFGQDSVVIKDGWSDLKVSDIQIFESQLRVEESVGDTTSILTYDSARDFISFKPVANNAFSYEGVEGELKSGGKEVKVSQSGNRFFGVADSKVIFKLGVEHDGKYDFKLFEPLDHTDAENDVISLNFDLAGQDEDGRILGGAKIIVDVIDDTPDAFNTFCYFYLDHLEQKTSHEINGVLQAKLNEEFSFGSDGAGRVHFVENDYRFFLGFDGEPADESAEIEEVELFSLGKRVKIDVTAKKVMGSVNGKQVFELTLNSLSGEYRYRQYQKIDHPQFSSSGRKFSNQLNMGFQIHVHDSDGDVVEKGIYILIMDEGSEKL